MVIPSAVRAGVLKASFPFRSPDGRALYVTMSNGMCRRVEYDGPELVFVQRKSKAQKKAEKRSRRHA